MEKSYLLFRLFQFITEDTKDKLDYYLIPDEAQYIGHYLCAGLYGNALSDEDYSEKRMIEKAVPGDNFEIIICLEWYC